MLVVSQPTWGVDAGAAAAIHQALLDLAAAGSAVVVISQDLDELLTLGDRLAVINVGRAVAARSSTAQVSVEEIGLLMGGVHGVDGRAAARSGRGGLAVCASRLNPGGKSPRAMLYVTPVLAVLR